MRKLNKEIKGNIKCEHCEHWENENWEIGICGNIKSEHFCTERRYCCRCKEFEYNHKYD